MHKLSLKKLEQSQPSPNRQLTDMHTGRDSKYLLVEDLNSEMMPNKPFDSHVSVSGGRAMNPRSQITLPEGDNTGFNETMSKVLAITQSQDTVNQPVKIT